MEISIRYCRVCKLSSNITKFIIKNNKIYGKRCCKCNSAANNARLKNKEYYAKYYIKNKDNKEKNKADNLVVFDF
jgi:hypothetical protein